MVEDLISAKGQKLRHTGQLTPTAETAGKKTEFQDEKRIRDEGFRFPWKPKFRHAKRMLQKPKSK